MDQHSHVVIPKNPSGFMNNIMKWYNEHPTVHIPKKNEPTIMPFGSSVGFIKN